MYETSDFRKGLKVKIDSQPFMIVEYQFVKPGKGVAFTRTKLKNMVTGSTLERTFRSGEKLEPADMEEVEMQYLYPDGDAHVFMNTTSYDQMTITGDQIGDDLLYLQDGTTVDVLIYEGRPIGFTPPTFIEMEVVETEPGFKGDTSSNTTKPAILTSGLTVNVPLFVNQGDMLKVDTRTKSYVERVKK
jgi:elongation factor P